MGCCGVMLVSPRSGRSVRKMRLIFMLMILLFFAQDLDIADPVGEAHPQRVRANPHRFDIGESAVGGGEFHVAPLPRAGWRSVWQPVRAGTGIPVTHEHQMGRVVFEVVLDLVLLCLYLEYGADCALHEERT